MSKRAILTLCCLFAAFFLSLVITINQAHKEDVPVELPKVTLNVSDECSGENSFDQSSWAFLAYQTLDQSNWTDDLPSLPNSSDERSFLDMMLVPPANSNLLTTMPMDLYDMQGAMALAKQGRRPVSTVLWSMDGPLDHIKPIPLPPDPSIDTLISDLLETLISGAAYGQREYIMFEDENGEMHIQPAGPLTLVKDPSDSTSR